MKLFISIVIALFIINTGCFATELTHHFANPNFIGGDPNKGAVLFNEANAQNGHKAPVVPKVDKTKTPAQLVSEKIQSALLTAISTSQSKSIKDNIFDADGKLLPNVTLNLGGGNVISTSAPDLLNDTMDITISDPDGLSNTVFTVPYVQ